VTPLTDVGTPVSGHVSVQMLSISGWYCRFSLVGPCNRTSADEHVNAGVIFHRSACPRMCGGGGALKARLPTIARSHSREASSAIRGISCRAGERLRRRAHDPGCAKTQPLL
jgi:hypothetical protein